MLNAHHGSAALARTAFLRIVNADSQERASRSGNEIQRVMNVRGSPATFRWHQTNVATPRGFSRSDAEFGFEQVVDGLRIGLAARRLHHLADEPADQLRLGLGLRD